MRYLISISEEKSDSFSLHQIPVEECVKFLVLKL